MAVEQNPKDHYAWSDKGRAFGLLGAYNESISAFDEAIRLDPNYAEAWHFKGVTLKALGRNEEANAAFAKAKELGYVG